MLAPMQKAHRLGFEEASFASSSFFEIVIDLRINNH